VRAGSRRAVLHSSQAAPLAGPSEPKRSGDPLRIPHRRSGAAFSAPCAGATARRAAGPGLTGIRTPRHLGSIALVRYGRYLKDILDISRVNYLLVSKI